MDNLNQFRAAGTFIDSDSPAVAAFVTRLVAGVTDSLVAVRRLYTAIRDEIIYDPYVDFTDPTNYRASGVLEAGHGFCVARLRCSRRPRVRSGFRRASVMPTCAII